MINSGILHRLRNSVCAVGYFDAALDSMGKTKQMDSGLFTIVGTGFVVREGIVMTNRHVLDDLEKPRKLEANSDSHVVFWVFREQEELFRQLAFTPRRIRFSYPLHGNHLDVAFISFNIRHPSHFHNVEPVAVDDPGSVVVSEPIAVLGYPHGKTLLLKDGRVNRWGPVLQQGWVSAISPFEGMGKPDEFLLDVRAADGISGSPVFRPKTGKVCGILHSGVFSNTANGERDEAGTTTAFAQPISDDLLAIWLSEFERERDSNT